MLSFGNNITSANENLHKITVDELYRKIAQPSAELRSRISQLRTLQSLDLEKYKQNKRYLPYFSCGIFTPMIRRIANFHFAQYFVLDIDHIGAKQMDLEQLRNVLMQDSRIVLMFVSPGNDGLKLMFRLSGPCYDAAQFSLFYKVFANGFSTQYHLQQVIDTCTSDVTRACFLSADENAWYNPDAEPVVMANTVNFENQLTVSIIEKELAITANLTDRVIPIDEAVVKNELSNDILAEIRQKLNPRLVDKKAKDVFVPEQLNTLLPYIQHQAAELNITIIEVIPIQYGKKIKFGVQHFWAEINVFHGKRGFSVVKTPKNGSNEQLTEIVYDMVVHVINAFDAC